MITLQPFEFNAFYHYLSQQMMLDTDDVDRDVLCVPANMLTRWTALALVYEGRVAGYVCFDMDQRYLAMLYVNPDFRGKGIAQYVIRLLQPAWLDVKPENLLARKLYERLGYVVARAQHDPKRVRYYHFAITTSFIRRFMEKQRTLLEEQQIHFNAVVTLIEEAEKVAERAEHLKDGFNHKPFAEMVDATVKVLRAQVLSLRPLMDTKTPLTHQQMISIRESASTVRTCMEQLDTGITLMTQRRNSKVINIGGLGNGR